MSLPDPRFSLANERTVLAWVRTGLAFVATGLGISTAAHVLELDAVLAVAGMAAVALGAALTVASVSRWRRVQRAIDADRHLPPNHLVTLAAVSVVVVAALSLLAAILQLS